MDYNGNHFAAALGRASDNLLILGNAELETLASYDLPTSTVTSLDFSPDGAMLVVGAAEGLISIWDTESHELIATRETEGGIYDVSFSPDGTMIAASTDRHSLFVRACPLGSG